MGYHTEFEGQFEITPTLAPNHIAYLTAFSETRHMKRRDVGKENPLREAVGLPFGHEGEYYVESRGADSWGINPDVIDNNREPSTQPGLWCKWAPSEDGTYLEWDGAEKFYDYVEWLKYLIRHFFVPWGYTLNGKVHWRGEEFSDNGRIIVENNAVRAEGMSW